MKTAGIIAEYNPFHTGHAYQLRKARERSGCDYTLVVMSPDFVQRGEPAIFDKYTRARMALLGGADVVVELPLCYASASAEYFALGAVALLDSLGAADVLCFGCETPDLSLLQTCAQVLDQEPESYRRALREGLRRGLTYPQAGARALAGLSHPSVRSIPGTPSLSPAGSFSAASPQKQDVLSGDGETELSKFFSTPNNILGVEYCKAIRRLGSSLAPLPLRRKGRGYSDPALEGEFCSATALRQGIARQKESGELLPYIPQECRGLFLSACQTPLYPDDLMPWLTRQLLIQEDFSRVFDVSPDLSRRIGRMRYSLTGKSWTETVGAVKTRQMTEARIRRALLHIILDLPQDLADRCRDEGPVFYARVLGFRKTAAPLLRRIKENSRIPLITRPAAAARSLTGLAGEMLAADFAASHLYRSLLAAKYHLPFRSEQEMGPVILP